MKLLYFAWIGERIGHSSDEVELPDNVKLVSELLDWLSNKGDEYENAFSDRELIKVAVNQTHVEHDSLITNATEIAFFPPVTGG